MRYLVSTIFFAVILLAAIALAGATVDGTNSSSANKRFNARLSPEYVSLLREQADARKQLFMELAKKKSEQKRTHAREQSELVLHHRAARAEFSSERHSAEERKVFFKNQRQEMVELRVRHKNERKELAAELKKMAAEFHIQQKHDQDELRSKIVQFTSP